VEPYRAVKPGGGGGAAEASGPPPGSTRGSRGRL